MSMFGKDALIISKKQQSLKIFKWVILFCGAWLWMAYRSQLTAVLSVAKNYQPFENLKEFSDSHYRYFFYNIKIEAYC